MPGEPTVYDVVETVCVHGGVGVHIDEDGDLWIGTEEIRTCVRCEDVKRWADRASRVREGTI